MELSKRHTLILAAAAAALIGAMLLVRLSGFGIWDPWELTPADEARRIAQGEAVELTRPLAQLWSITAGFQLFGAREWAGRLPIAIAGLLAVLLAFVFIARGADRRGGIYAALIAGTTPLFIFNSRQMLGDGVAILAQTMLAIAAFFAVFPGRPLFADDGAASSSTKPFDRSRVLFLLGVVLALALATLARGMLLGALPPLLAVSTLAALRGHLGLERLGVLGRGTEATIDRGTAISAWVVTLVTVVAVVWVGVAIGNDVAEYTHAIGGTPRGGTPPTFDAVIENVFHSFAPWSALLPLAFGRALFDRGAATAPTAASAEAASNPGSLAHDQSALRVMLVLWATFGYAAQTLYTARYGAAAFIPVVALAGAVALLLRDVEESQQPWWPASIVALLMTGLLVRDFGLYPGGPIQGLPLSDITVPNVFNPKREWTAVLGLFAIAAALGLGVGPSMTKPDFLAPYRLLLAQWRRGVPFKVWLILGGLALIAAHFLAVLMAAATPGGPPLRGQPLLLWPLVLVLMLLQRFVVPRISSLRPDGEPLSNKGFARVFGGLVCVLAFSAVVQFSGVVPNAETLGIPTIVLNYATRLGLVLPAILVLVAVAQITLFAFSRLGKLRLAPLLLAGVLVGGWAAQGYLPMLSAHFSPREVYDTFNKLAKSGEPLGEYRVGGRAASYYAQGELREIKSQPELIDFLAAGERRWASFPADELAAVNRAFRKRTGRHLFVADARSARVVLATNQDVAGVENQSFIAKAVLKEAPPVDRRVGAKWEDKIELIGYDLELPHDGYVGAGETFTIVWYYRVLAEIPGGYKIFLHVDGHGNRLNGDHEPVDEKYPVRYWDPGDIVVDRQTLTVPANYRPGPYTMFLGFFSGDEARLRVVEGPRDNANRVEAGILQVR